ncbi:type II toxin-antitoxin system HicA family toxin [Euhalothece natronophila Z-M001]|uniref:Type II toxin-antitoxin system HicA family toxin n=1 Tax=Euhalothece natronophila Z-M001 TaxID=522448 RepID=A0A5B8NKX8_9CHRO|nr:type II toxin-antitoxin system HicA family toxin [Euhalothece natronophila]QDZ39734.1 type II toxin-antitoxin system HicA family toxin [Euhalothece natronophila Z-M001]
MRRLIETGKETLTIPKHKQLDTGTCRAILKQASQYISLSELAEYFYE